MGDEVRRQAVCFAGQGKVFRIYLKHGVISLSGLPSESNLRVGVSALDQILIAVPVSQWEGPKDLSLI